jgi:micrococcal nuclease
MTPMRRSIPYLHFGDRNINIEMVHDGFARWYRTYALKSKTLEQTEAEARKEKRGLWRDKNAERPREFRKKERESEREK